MERISIKRGLILLFITSGGFLSVNAQYEYTTIEDITYRIVEKAKSAEVYAVPSEKETVILPEKINYNGEEYLVSKIKSEAFGNHKALKKIVIPDNISTIEARSFYGCESLEAIDFPSSLKKIEPSVCYGCKELKSVKIGKSVIEIEADAFDECNNLEKVIIDDIAAWCNIDLYIHNTWSEAHISSSPLNIAGNLYIDDKLVTDLVIPEGTSIIKAGVFEGCRCLESITLPKSLESVERYAFWGTEPKRINISDIESYCNVIFIDNPLAQAGHLFLNGQEITSVEVPNTVTQLYGTFWGASSLTSVKIPNSVKSISENTFSFCGSLEKIDLPEYLSDIGGGAFRYCSSLKSIEIPDNVKVIGKECFWGCFELEKISMGKSVTSLGYSCFALCPKLKDFYSYSQYPPNVVRDDLGGLFGESDVEYATLHVLSGSIEYYSQAKYWSDFGKIMAIEDSSTEGIVNVKANLVIVQNEGGVINITGLSDGSKVEVFNLSGKKVASAIAHSEKTSIQTPLKSGEIGLIRIGDKCIKVIIE